VTTEALDIAGNGASRFAAAAPLTDDAGLLIYGCDT
jgi:hypothetical protein